MADRDWMDEARRNRERREQAPGREYRERWNPGLRSDSGRADWSRSEFGVGSEYGPDYAFRDFPQAQRIRDRWVRDLREDEQRHHGEDWDDARSARNYMTRDRGEQGSDIPRGPYTGRGPKGYQRSDERIREDICERLTQHGYIDATDLEVRVENAEVTLSGTVPDRRMKRLAEDVAEQVSGVRDVHNNVRPAASGERHAA